MFKIKMAGEVIEIDNIHSYIKEYCREYLCDDAPAFRVKTTVDEIKSYLATRGIESIDDATAERILVYKKIAAKLAERGMFLLHSGVISYKGKGIAFVASRGVGKTTHAMLWKHSFWDDVKFVNGDKPIVKCENGKFVAYTSPWKGKEGLGEIESIELSAIVFIERGDKPSVKSIAPRDAVALISNQSIAPESRVYDGEFSENIAAMLKSVPLYAAKVNMDKESAVVVRDYIFK